MYFVNCISCALHVYCLYTACILLAYYMYIACILRVYCLYTTCILDVYYVYTTCRHAFYTAYMYSICTKTLCVAPGVIGVECVAQRVPLTNC